MHVFLSRWLVDWLERGFVCHRRRLRLLLFTVSFLGKRFDRCEFLCASSWHDRDRDCNATSYVHEERNLLSPSWPSLQENGKHTAKKNLISHKRFISHPCDSQFLPLLSFLPFLYYSLPDFMISPLFSWPFFCLFFLTHCVFPFDFMYYIYTYICTGYSLRDFFLFFIPFRFGSLPTPCVPLFFPFGSFIIHIFGNHLFCIITSSPLVFYRFVTGFGFTDLYSIR